MPYFPEKAYNNRDFLNSPPARTIRIVCEYEETRQRLRAHDIRHTIVFFGSARTKSASVAQEMLTSARLAISEHPDDADAIEALRLAEVAVRMSIYYEAARELSQRLTRWSMDRDKGRDYYITTGGGPGIMEAGNRGAHEAGGKSVGLGISLPFEAGVNDYVTKDLAFEFHYFFTRKLWFLYTCKGLVVFPGGFGTLDELFESVTLVQTKKIKKKLPIVLFGTDYWSKVLHMDVMAEYGTISPHDPDLLHRTDSVDEAFQILTSQLDEADGV